MGWYQILHRVLSFSRCIQSCNYFGGTNWIYLFHKRSDISPFIKWNWYSIRSSIILLLFLIESTVSAHTCILGAHPESLRWPFWHLSSIVSDVFFLFSLYYMRKMWTTIRDTFHFWITVWGLICSTPLGEFQKML